MSGIV
jgi:hypothetical protein